MQSIRVSLFGSRAAALLALLSLLAGCNNCEKLTERVCSELGDDCALWKEIGGPDDIIPGGAKVNRACGEYLDDELTLDSVINTARGKVLIERLNRAVKTGDKAEADEVKGELDENRKRIEAGIEKVKQRTGR